MRLQRLVTAIAGAALLAGCSFSSIRAERDLSLTAAHVADAPLHVESRNGGIEVIVDPTMTEVAIDAHLQCGGDTVEEAEARVAASRVEVSRDTGRTLHITVVFDGGARSNDGARFTVRLPDVQGVEARTGNGSITVKGSRGELVAVTSNGRVTVDDHDGSVDVRSSNGRLELSNVAGPVEGHTSNGSIGVRLANSVAGPVHLTSSNGSIILAVGPAFCGRVDMSTSNGSVSLEDGAGMAKGSSISKRSGSVSFAEGDDSQLKTSNGSIKLVTASAP